MGYDEGGASAMVTVIAKGEKTELYRTQFSADFSGNCLSEHGEIYAPTLAEIIVWLKENGYKMNPKNGLVQRQHNGVWTFCTFWNKTYHVPDIQVIRAWG
jgi:hypothetical protein